MSKNRDYTRYSKEPIEVKESVESKAVIEVEEHVETAVECELEIEEPKVEETKYVTGIVTDCLKLNVREDPYPTATILGIITASTELIVNTEESVDEFYKVCTATGLEGYCMKKFVTIMP